MSSETKPTYTYEILAEFRARLQAETHTAYLASPFSALSRNYFSRFSREASTEPADNETAIDEMWRIVVVGDNDSLSRRMAEDLQEFLAERMTVALRIVSVPVTSDATKAKAIIVLGEGSETNTTAGSFTIHVTDQSVAVLGADMDGLRDGVVRLVDEIGFRQSPFVTRGIRTYTPRLAVRMGSIPLLGTIRDLVFAGYNAVEFAAPSLFAVSRSEALPELNDYRKPDVLDEIRQSLIEAKRYGLKVYVRLRTTDKFSKDHPVFQNHPDIRGTLTYKEDGDYILCTQHSRVRQYLCESVSGLFETLEGLDGISIIVGGEGFYHCFMHSYGAPKGRSACPRCDAMGPDVAVADLCNYLAEAARAVNPNAEVVAWPYSAEHIWAMDDGAIGFIRNLGPGTVLLTEIEKGQVVEKGQGVRKVLWDYSIDYIGPCDRARKQIAACREQGIPVYLKSEPELSFEAPGLPQIPCMDRWLDRAEALASCGASGAWVFPVFRPCYGTSANEIGKVVWFEPRADNEEILNAMAKRIAGSSAAEHLRRAWRLVSEAIELVPEMPNYYRGPYYLGPAHPMCADPDVSPGEAFGGYFLFQAEAIAKDGLVREPAYWIRPDGDPLVLGPIYRQMEELMFCAVQEISTAKPLVDEQHRLMFAAEESVIRWFYHITRAEANFHESCLIRDRLTVLRDAPIRTEIDSKEANTLLLRWREVLQDELENARAALPVMEADVRLDFYYGGNHSFEHGAVMLREKIRLLEGEIAQVLPRFEGL